MTETDRIRHIRHVIGPWVAIAVVLVVALGGVTLALIAQSQATQVAVCVNHNLGSRNAPASSDATAHIAFAQAIQTVLHEPKGADPAKVSADFNTKIDAYVHTLVADQAVRDSQPLGKC